MDNQDHTMKFQFSDDSQEQVVNEILHSVYESLEKKAIIQQQIVGYYYQGTLLTSPVIEMHGI